MVKFFIVLGIIVLAGLLGAIVEGIMLACLGGDE